MIKKAEDIFKNYDKIYAIYCEDKSTGMAVFSLIEEDMIFWAKLYNNLDNEIDYNFYFSLRKEYPNGFHYHSIMPVSELIFIEVMEGLMEVYNWKNNRFGIELELNKNRRFHKLFQKMEFKKESEHFSSSPF